jgi:uncharacterized membrane protein
MHPLQRILLSVVVAAVTFFFIRNKGLTDMLLITILWDVFALSFVITSWAVFFTRPVHGIVQLANKEDGSRLFVLVSVLVSSFASMLAVLVLMVSKKYCGNHENLAILLAVIGMMTTWAMVHTIFALHYAHLYYSRSKNDKDKDSPLDFPKETHPDYLDFAYFAFGIGMTFQVSDVTIHSRRIRRTVLAHSLLAFALNTFVVALTINIIAGLRK